MPYRLPIGPYHPALEEPYKLTVTSAGETVQAVEVEIGFSFRSIELLAQRRNYMQGLTLMERVCGICSHVHGMAFCMAVERLAGLEAPPRARYLRVVVAELERLHSHLLWLGIAAEDIGFKTMFLETFALRERVLDALEQVSGNRVNYGMNAFGGVARDVRDPSAILAAVAETRRALEREIVPVFAGNPTVRARTAGVGPLRREEALAYGCVGPTARASGIASDLRADDGYAVYRELGFRAVVETAGDVQARLVVRAREMLESVRLIEAALTRLPEGPVRAGSGFPAVPPGETTVRVEAPRGELFYYLRADGTDTPRRLKIRTPSFMNIPALQAMCVGQRLADLPIIQASVDPCCSCTDR